MHLFLEWVVASALTNPACRSKLHHPLIIAHRGGNPNNRQSSIEAYKAAAASGEVNFLECDITSTKDGILVCAHSPDVGRIGSVDFKNEQAKTLQILEPIMGSDKKNIVNSPTNGKNSAIKDWYIPDYDWSEVMRISATCSDLVEICTQLPKERLAKVEELLQIADKAPNHTIGVYLEVKHAFWHSSRRNIDLVQDLMTLLKKFGNKELVFRYPVFLQTFEFSDLVRIRGFIGFESSICTVALIDDVHHIKHDHELRLKMQDVTKQESIEGLEMLSSVWIPLNKQCDTITCLDNCVAVGYMSTVHGNFKLLTDEEWYNNCPIEFKRISEDLIYSCPNDDICFKSDQLDTCVTEYYGETLSSFWTMNSRYVDLTCLADIIAPSIAMLEKYPKIANTMYDRKVEVHTWTINTEYDLKTALSLKVKGVITDDYHLISRLLSRSRQNQ